MSIRHACANDVERIIDVFERAQQVSPVYKYRPIDRGIVKASLEYRLFNPMSLVAVNSKMDGVLVATATESLSRAELMIANEFFYAESEGHNFVREYKRWADGFHMPYELNLWVSFGGDLGDKASKLFSVMGFEPIGQQHRLVSK